MLARSTATIRIHYEMMISKTIDDLFSRSFLAAQMNI